MEGWEKKEFSNQGTEKLRSIIKDRLGFDDKAKLDDFTNHMTVVGATFFNKCWSTAVVFSRLVEREHPNIVTTNTPILPHPLCLLFSHNTETNTYNLTTTLIYVPKNEYVSLYHDLNDGKGAYKIPNYKTARRYLTILCDLIRWFIIDDMNNQTSLFTYDSTKDCVTLNIRYSRQRKCINHLELLQLNSYLESQLSNIVGNFKFDTFRNRGTVTFDDFMKNTIIQPTTSRDDDDQFVTNNNLDDDDVGNKHHVISNQKLIEDDDRSTHEDVNKEVDDGVFGTAAAATAATNAVAGAAAAAVTAAAATTKVVANAAVTNSTAATTLSPSNDNDKDNNNDITNPVDTQYEEDDGSSTVIDYSSPEDDSDDIVNDNKDITDQLVTDNNDNERRNKQKSILILGMSTVDVRRSLDKKGNTDILDNISLTTAKQCVTQKVISTSDGRDLARINAIKIRTDTNVYTVSLVNTNPTMDSSSNPTVYDNKKHLHANYNGRNFVSSLEQKFHSENHQVQFQEIYLDYYYMPPGYRSMSELISSTIPSMANNNILSEGGEIYLPFQLSIFSQIVAHYNKLREKYSISFIGCTQKNTLWSCTQEIAAKEMLEVFEKNINQEEQYCIITDQEIKQNSRFNVDTDQLLEIFNRIENPANIRFIQLTLAKGDDLHLGYVGLRKSRKVHQSGAKRKLKNKRPIVHNKKQCFIPTTTIQNLNIFFERNWPAGNDTKDMFRSGIHRLLDIESVSHTKTMPKLICEEEPIQEDVRSILEIVKQKFPEKLEKVRKALSDIEE